MRVDCCRRVKSLLRGEKRQIDPADHQRPHHPSSHGQRFREPDGQPRFDQGHLPYGHPGRPEKRLSIQHRRAADLVPAEGHPGRTHGPLRQGRHPDRLQPRDMASGPEDRATGRRRHPRRGVLDGRRSWRRRVLPGPLLEARQVEDPERHAAQAARQHALCRRCRRAAEHPVGGAGACGQAAVSIQAQGRAGEPRRDQNRLRLLAGQLLEEGRIQARADDRCRRRQSPGLVQPGRRARRPHGWRDRRGLVSDHPLLVPMREPDCLRRALPHRSEDWRKAHLGRAGRGRAGGGRDGDRRRLGRRPLDDLNLGSRHIVLLPGTVEECYEFGRDAFDYADRFQTPVFVLSDLDLGMNLWMTPEFKYPDREFDRGKVLTKDDLERLAGEWARYRDVDGDGVTYRTIPGTDHPAAGYFTRGSGHDEMARYTESADAYARNMDRLARKLETARHTLPAPVADEAGLPIGLIAFGSTDAAVVEARETLAAEGRPVDYLRVRALPLSDEVAAFVGRHDHVYVVEQNRDGQLYDLIRLALPAGLVDRLRSIRHYNGQPIPASAIIEPLMEKEAVH